jgi:hypothetical protein
MASIALRPPVKRLTSRRHLPCNWDCWLRFKRAPHSTAAFRMDPWQLPTPTRRHSRRNCLRLLPKPLLAPLVPRLFLQKSLSFTIIVAAVEPSSLQSSAAWPLLRHCLPIRSSSYLMAFRAQWLRALSRQLRGLLGPNVYNNPYVYNNPTMENQHESAYSVKYSYPRPSEW